MQYGARDWTTLGAEGVLAVERAAELGLDGVELNARSWPPEGPMWDPAERRRIVTRARELGVRIPSTGFGVLNQGGLAGTAEQQVRGVQVLRQAIDATADLGATVMMLQHLGANNSIVPEKVGQVVDGIRQLIPLAVERGVTLALEDNIDAEANLRLIEMVGSPNLKVYYDVCNTWAVGHDVVADIKKLVRAGALAQVHFKNRTPDGVQCDLEPGEVDVPACAAALREVGYDGWIVLETPGGNEPIGKARENLEYLRRFI
jgi:sugar phosphate isomerase/epimerase